MTLVTLFLTLWLCRCVDLVHTYLPFEYCDDPRSLRQSNYYFNVWPWKVNIWPWGQKFKIPLSVSFAYGPKEHSCTFITLSYQNCRRSSRKRVKSAKNGNDLCDLDFDLVTLRSWGYVDLVHTYLAFEYGDDRRSLRSPNAHFKVWPLTPYIWPWRSKFKIPPHEISLYWPKEHSCVFIWLSYQNCRRR